MNNKIEANLPKDDQQKLEKVGLDFSQMSRSASICNNNSSATTIWRLSRI